MLETVLPFIATIGLIVILDLVQYVLTSRVVKYVEIESQGVTLPDKIKPKALGRIFNYYFDFAQFVSYIFIMAVGVNFLVKEERFFLAVSNIFILAVFIVGLFVLAQVPAFKYGAYSRDFYKKLFPETTGAHPVIEPLLTISPVSVVGLSTNVVLILVAVFFTKP